MKTSFWTPYISDHTIKAICWTLIHSLWIGMAIAVLTGLVITLTRKSNATLRYRLLCSILVLFVISAGITFYLEMRTPGLSQSATNGTGTFISNPNNVIVINKATPHVNLFNKTVGFLNQNTDIIFIAWLLFFMLKSLKMVSGLLYIQRIRNYKIHEVADEFKQKIEMFSRQIGIGRTVRLVQSELVKVPVAVGWLKPLILLPVGIILQLSTEQLESILWHELAHIRRRDYLVNILQGLVETIFFFNPGLLWLSSLIRAEREACCDDMVLSRMNRKANYLEALLAFSYQDNSKMVLAMSIGSGNQLRDRLKRMVSQENKRLSMAEKIVLAAGLVLLSAFTTLPKTTNMAVKHLIHVMAKNTGSVATAKPMVIEAVMKAQPEPIHLQQPAIDTTTIKTDTAVRFTSVLFDKSDADVSNSDIRAMDNKGNKYHFIVADSKLVAMELNGVKVSDNELASHQYLISQIYYEIAQKRRVRREDIAGYKANSPTAKFKYGFRKDSIWSKAYNDQLIRRSDVNPKYMKSEAMMKRRFDDSVQYVGDRARVNGVIAELVARGVVSDAAKVQWFGLTDTELIVNGQKQPAELQQKLKEAYGVHQDYGLYYGPVQMTGTGVFIGTDEDRAHSMQRINFEQRKSIDLQNQLLKESRIKDQAMLSRQKETLWRNNELMKQQANQQKLKTQQQYANQEKIAVTMVIQNVIGDLIDENIVKDKNDLSFNLTNTYLVVNGVKQPDAVHQRLKNKYLKEVYSINQKVTKDPDFGLHYDARNGGMGIGISESKSFPDK